MTRPPKMIVSLENAVISARIPTTAQFALYNIKAPTPTRQTDTKRITEASEIAVVLRLANKCPLVKAAVVILNAKIGVNNKAGVT